MTAASEKAGGKRKRLVLDSVLECAASLFAEKGFSATTLQDVADALGVSRPSIYHYFSSKEEILNALVEGVSIASVSLVNLPLAADAAAYAEALRTDVRSICLHIAQNRDVYRVLHAPEGQLPPGAAERFRQGKLQVSRRLATLVRQGCEAGAFREVDCELAAAGILALATWMGQPNTVTAPHDIGALADSMSDMAVRSVAADQPQKPPTLHDLIGRMRADLASMERLAVSAPGYPA